MTNKAMDYSNYFWQGNTIQLCPITIEAADLRFIQSFDSISIEELNIGIHLPTTLSQQEASIEKFSGCREVDGMIAFAIKNHEQELVGFANMHSIDERHGKFGFSVIVGRQYRKRGYALDAVCLILKYGFLERRFHKCNSACASYNAASVQMHRKLGFFQEGTLRDEWFHNGKHHDEFIFGMTLDEYIANFPI